MYIHALLVLVKMSECSPHITHVMSVDGNVAGLFVLFYGAAVIGEQCAGNAVPSVKIYIKIFAVILALDHGGVYVKVSLAVLVRGDTEPANNVFVFFKKFLSPVLKLSHRRLLRVSRLLRLGLA